MKALCKALVGFALVLAALNFIAPAPAQVAREADQSERSFLEGAIAPQEPLVHGPAKTLFERTWTPNPVQRDD